MMEKEGLLKVIHRLATDDGFRHRLMVAPREALMAELEISAETYSALVAIVPVLLAGGLFLLGDGASPGPDAPTPISPEWGRWAA